MKKFLALASVLFATAALADEGSYVSVQDLVGWQGARYEKYKEILKRFETGFDRICGDTFCEGDFANLTTLSFECTAHDQSLKMGSCMWVIAGSRSDINAKTGALETETAMYKCPIKVSGTIDEFLSLADTVETQYSYNTFYKVPVPGTQDSAYSQLASCL